MLEGFSIYTTVGPLVLDVRHIVINEVHFTVADDEDPACDVYACCQLAYFQEDARLRVNDFLTCYVFYIVSTTRANPC